MEKDERFAHVATDPRFRRMPKAERKVCIDKRFQAMFADNRFNIKYTLDKRGRPASYSSGENLKKFYECSSSSSDDSGSEEEEGKESGEGSESEKETKESDEESESEKETKESDEESELSEEGEEEKEVEYFKKGGTERSDKARKKKIQTESKADKKEKRKSVSESCKNKKQKGVQNKVKKEMESEKEDLHVQNADVDYARGGGLMLTDSSSEEESEEEEEIVHNWGELNKTDEAVEEPTSRLAVCNLVWDRMKAKHIMMLLSSFIPPGGSIQSVTIYPSEYGLKRMAEENQLGPKELVQEKMDLVDFDNDNISNENESFGSYFDIEKLRDYQIKRLQYYYAVVVCDSTVTANHLYEECDGMEFENTSNELDLRFIPDDMEFDQEPHDTCTIMIDANELQMDYFCSQALQCKKVSLTWDETDPERFQLQKKLFNDVGGVDEDDLKIYLGSGSSSEEEEGKEAEKKEKVSVNGTSIEDGKNGGDSVSRYRDLLLSIKEEKKKEEEKDVQMEVTWELGLEEKTKELMKKIEQKDNKSPWETFLEKRKEKKIQKLQDRRRQKQNRQEKETSDDYIPAGINMNDPYFQEEFDESEFPSTREEKKSWKSRIKKQKEEEEEEESEENRQAKAELELLTMDENSNKNHFSLKSILAREKEEGKTKKTKNKNKMKLETKSKQKNEDKFQLDLNDPRFEAVYTSHHFHIDPTHSNFKKTKGSQAFIEEKQRRRKMDSSELPSKKSREEIKQKNEQDLSLLVKSVKNKTANFLKTRKQKL